MTSIDGLFIRRQSKSSGNMPTFFWSSGWREIVQLQLQWRERLGQARRINQKAKAKAINYQGQQNMFPRPQFFPSQSLNIAELILREGFDDAIAIYFAREEHALEEVIWSNLRQRTASARGALVNSGVKVGDKVAAVISNSVDAVVLCLATLSIGAIWSSASCDLGAKAIVDRLSQVKPKIVFADNGYIYGRKRISLVDRIAGWSSEIAKDNTTLENVVLIPNLEIPDQILHISKGITWSSFLKKGSGEKLSFERLPFDHPAFILFSSGTVCLQIS